MFNDELTVWISLISCKKGAIRNSNVKNSNGWSVDMESDRNEYSDKPFVKSYLKGSNIDCERS
jgi:hypothetical protein